MTKGDPDAAERAMAVSSEGLLRVGTLLALWGVDPWYRRYGKWRPADGSGRPGGGGEAP